MKIHEVLAFAVSMSAVGYGVFHLFRKGTPKYFQLYVCASGCYMLEELWVIVNSLLGYGSLDGLITVRLFGVFGCLCFMLSANVNEFDRVVDEGKNRKARGLALILPAVLLAVYAGYLFSPRSTNNAVLVFIVLLSTSPALFAAYFSLKHLLLPEDDMGFLKCTKWIDVVAIVFDAANIGYPLLSLYCSNLFLSIYDVALAGMLFGMIVLCRRGAVKWKTLI